MSRIRVDSLRDRNDSGTPTLVNGLSIPGNQSLVISGRFVTTGISTLASVKATHVTTTGVTTATTFIGDGSGLTNIASVTKGKVISYELILDPLPFRS